MSGHGSSDLSAWPFSNLGPRHATVSICRVNMGTADELAIDVLINMLSNFSRE